MASSIDPTTALRALTPEELSADEKELQGVFASAPIAKLFGMKMDFNSQKGAICSLPYNPQLDHAFRMTHGGVFATILDTACWFTIAHAHKREDRVRIVTVDLTVKYFKSARKTSLRGVGRVIKKGMKIDVVEAFLIDDKNSVVGHATASFMIADPPSAKL
eukprot:TRINITY_DN9704_c0_g1_i1.p1 TRINITY_DN9704_c0_g1~~TRINITY_DN9704_c0_g1_i1.p1  ORF type:complete len:161 (-),score=21.08 TRINITY_DN9704_c0_g1_i1:110-592(-)